VHLQVRVCESRPDHAGAGRAHKRKVQLQRVSGQTRRRPASHRIRSASSFRCRGEKVAAPGDQAHTISEAGRPRRGLGLHGHARSRGFHDGNPQLPQIPVACRPEGLPSKPSASVLLTSTQDRGIEGERFAGGEINQDSTGLAHPEHQALSELSSLLPPTQTFTRHRR